MSWDSWLDRLKGDNIMDCAIVGYTKDEESVWSATQGFKSITAAEIKMLVATDRSPLFSGKLTLAGIKCTLLRDGTDTMDIKTKASAEESQTYGIAIAKSKKALIICKGQKDTHGGALNKKVFDIKESLMAVGY